jgi:endoribonuclease Dicer
MAEQHMRHNLKSETPDERPEFEAGVAIPEEFKYRIESTGALLTIYNAQEVLLKYCFSLPRDKYLQPNPEYLVAEGPHGFASELHMPPNVRKDCLVLRGTLQSSTQLAKREVAFRMVKLLHALGELDDNFCSKNQNIDPKTGQTIRLPSYKPLFMQKQVRKHRVTVPTHFNGRWESKIPLYINVIRLWNDSTDETLNVGFLSSKPSTHATKPFEIYMNTVRYQMQIASYKQSINFDPEHLENLKTFHFEFFKSVLRSKFDEKMKWATLCLPLISNVIIDESIDPSKIIDWEAIKFAGIVERGDLAIFAEGKAPLADVSDYVLFDKRRYSRSHIILEILPDKNPTNVIEPAMSKKYTSVEHVYRKRLQYTGSINLEQFVIRAQPLGYPYRCNILESELDEAILIPELCVKLPVKYRHLQHARKFPLLLQYIHHRLLMEDLITGVKFPNQVSGFDADINFMQEAFTAPASQLQFNYERMETFGDSFLKVHLSLHMFVMYPFRNEGFLTQSRADLENNKCLRKNANRHNLEGFILTDTLVRHHYIPPTMDATPQQEISDKGVADVVESAIAACFLTNGEPAASKCIRFILGDEMKPSWSSYYLHWCSHTIPKNLLEPSMISSCKLLQKRVGYTFKNISLLAEALTHSSAVNGVNSYERLEFLGKK